MVSFVIFLCFLCSMIIPEPPCIKLQRISSCLVAPQDKEVQSVQRLVPYKIVDGQDGAAWVEVQGNKMSPSQVYGVLKLPTGLA